MAYHKNEVLERLMTDKLKYGEKITYCWQTPLQVDDNIDQ